jgi:hypothetical protein
MPMICNQVKGKLQEMVDNRRFGLHLAGRKPEDPSVSTLLPMLIGSIVIVVIGVIVGLILY